MKPLLPRPAAGADPRPPQDPIRVAVVTPTFGRAAFLDRTYRYFKAQQAAGLLLHWFVLDDSPQPQTSGWCRDDVSVSYQWQASRMTLGAKRNHLNDMAAAWGAELVCAMDDDDWYGPSYVSSMLALLQGGPHLFAGSGEDLLLDMATGRIIRIPPARPDSSCNGVLCFDACVLAHRRYDESARSGEEPAFLGDSPVAQHPDIGRVHLALAHPSNTVTKKNYLRSQQLFTPLSLDDFPMDAEDRAFYRALMRR